MSTRIWIPPASRLPWREVLAVAPAVAVAGYGLGPVAALMVTACSVPLALRTRPLAPGPAPEPATPRDALVHDLDVALASATGGRSTACIVLCLDNAAPLTARFGHAALDRVQARTEERLTSALRAGDRVRHLDDGRFGIALAPGRRLDLETVLQITARLQAAVAEPLSIEAMTVYTSASAGFCLPSRAPDRTGAAMLDAAAQAMEDAWRSGPGAIRAYSPELARAAAERAALRDDLEAALDGGEIGAYFQPQLSTDTGEVIGFEALARWTHPARGLIPPADFLPAVQAAGLATRLGEVMLRSALIQLAAWDRAGLNIPRVSVNFSQDELSDPALAGRLKWELDRYEMAPGRLTIEILETVIAGADDGVVARNIMDLARLGCGIDLDDFGTGHASITALRRFKVQRIKIDRSFVTRIDTDPQQQQMLAAILSMADRLGLATLAEGVESIGEHSMLSQLGCSAVQGFAIARPMPASEVPDWLARHRTKLAQPPRIGRRAV